MSIQRFFEELLDGRGQVEASEHVSRFLFGRGPYRAAAIRNWARQFRLTGALPAAMIQAGLSLKTFVAHRSC